MEEIDLTGAEWRKSSFSGGNGQCVEAADLGTHIAVRHSLAPEGPVVLYTRSEWAAFTAGVRNGEFDF
ncbi:DUF397 domain-containing protein [Nonomuraea sp. NPDC005650]|uniref:DUF397 domain-containing protein n=1 Tax=Nonomuraea sp. NPDC005650 TaxID=3157045 RepID=UPI0033BCC36F